jgi:uncharacterized protein YsxB (DUF464 family)
MIRVNVQYQNQLIVNIDISGHADSALKGQDLVCASVSSMATGALNALDQLCPDACQLTLLDQKTARITIELIQFNNTVVQTILQTLLIQLRTLESSHSSFIQIQEVVK